MTGQGYLRLRRAPHRVDELWQEREEEQQLGVQEIGQQPLEIGALQARFLERIAVIDSFSVPTLLATPV